jgi:hypothetical protein
VADPDTLLAVGRIVQRFQVSPLTPDVAGRLRAALCDAGLWRHSTLDSALRPWGLSTKQIVALTLAEPATPAAPPASAGRRRIPPPE